MTTFGLQNLTNKDDVWNYGVADLWDGWGSIWNIESQDHVTGKQTLPWYPSGDIMHYFPTYAYKFSTGDLYVFDENNSLSQHFYGVDPQSLFNASRANNRTNGVQPQVVF